MATVDAPADAPPLSIGGSGSPGLARNALGLGGLLFCVATAAAPLTAMLFNVPIATMGAGSAGPAAFLVATLMLTVFAVGYVAMARRVTTTGGFYSFVSHSFGRVLGLGTAGLITFSYALFTAALAATFGYFASTTVRDFTGVDLPAWLYVFAGIAAVTVLAYFHIHLTSRLLGVTLISELVVLLVFGVAVLIHGGDSGIPAQAINPLQLPDNSEAVRVFGAAGVGVALFGAFWSWVGFEMAPNYAEETTESRRLMGVVTYASVIGLGLVYVFISWMFVAGWGAGKVADGVAAQFKGTYASAFYPLTDRYVGHGLTRLFEILIVTSCFACTLAFYNTASRYLFAMGREGILPRWLARTHDRHRSPYVASLVLTAAVTGYAVAFTLYDPTTTGTLAKFATWTPLLAVSGLLAVQALVSFGIVWYFWRQAREDFHWWRTLVAPALGGLAMVFSLVLLYRNRETLAGAKNVPFVTLIPAITLLVFLAGVGLAVWFRLRDPARYGAVGRFVHEDALTEEPA
jgi:amino acid transporter